MKTRLFTLMGLLVVASMLIAACGGAATTAAPTAGPAKLKVVLLLNGDLERNLSLVQRMAQACRLATPPMLLGVARDAAVHTEMFALARRCELIYLGAQCNPEDEKRAWAAIAPLLAGWRNAANSGWPVVPLRA